MHYLSSIFEQTNLRDLEPGVVVGLGYVRPGRVEEVIYVTKAHLQARELMSGLYSSSP
jgi:hypothetical protein